MILKILLLKKVLEQKERIAVWHGHHLKIDKRNFLLLLLFFVAMMNMKEKNVQRIFFVIKNIFITRNRFKRAKKL